MPNHSLTELTAIRRARAYLLAVAEPPAPALWAFVEAHGPIDAATRVHRRAAPDEVLRETQGRSGYDRVDFDFEIAAEEQARLVIPEDDEWPATQLAALSSLNPAEYRWTAPPLALWVRSKQRLDAACVKAVAIAGTTVPTAYGMTVASDLGAGLAGAGVSVMSGLSRGIAEAALRGALHGGAPAVAVRPCGIDRRDVVGHEGLLDRIAEDGLVISEHPPHTRPQRRRFFVRNRLIAALTQGVVIVEAGSRSGVRHIVKKTRSLGRPVMAVPGPITSRQSAYCHEILHEGDARLISDTTHILKIVSTSQIHHELAGPSPTETVADHRSTN